MGPLLSVENLTVQFRTAGEWLTAVEDVSFDVRPCESLGVVGESGSGKSVSALSILRLHASAATRLPSGVIRYGGRDLLTLSRREMRHIRGGEIAMIFQDPMSSLNPVLTIADQIAETLRLHQQLTAAAARKRAIELLQLVRIPDAARRIDDYPHRLSGGMRQRVMIAIAIACRPKLLIADEPTTALDVTIQAQILALLRELVSGEHTALILITHDLGVVAGMCERVNVMYAGMFVETGSAEQLFAAPRHPYTLGLLQSVPRLDATRRARLQPIEGSPRNMLRPPTACPFQPRCRYEVEQSRLEVPQLRELEPDHFVACFNPVPVEEWEQTRAAITAG